MWNQLYRNQKPILFTCRARFKTWNSQFNCLNSYEMICIYIPCFMNDLLWSKYPARQSCCFRLLPGQWKAVMFLLSVSLSLGYSNFLETDQMFWSKHASLIQILVIFIFFFFFFSFFLILIYSIKYFWMHVYQLIKNMLKHIFLI